MPMAETVNLRRARKANARAEAEAVAKANRVTHGRAKAEKLKSKAERDVANRRLDGHQRNKGDTADDD